MTSLLPQDLIDQAIATFGSAEETVRVMERRILAELASVLPESTKGEVKPRPSLAVILPSRIGSEEAGRPCLGR